MVYSLLIDYGQSKTKGPASAEPPPVPTDISKPAQNTADSPPPLPQLPEPPKLVEPTAPVVKNSEEQKEEINVAEVIELKPQDPPPIQVKEDMPPPFTGGMPATNSTNLVNPSSNKFNLPSQFMDSEEEQRRKDVKRKAAIILIAGTLPKKNETQIQQESDFKKRGDLSLVLGRGKFINAILESTINTDFGGEIRAIISRDIFSENGKVILIPKGSKVFGSYSNDTQGTYGRINVAWERIDLPSGYSLNFTGQTVDNLGRKGVQGRVDDRLKEKFTNAVLVSAFSIAFAQALDKVVAPVQKSETAIQNKALSNNILSLAQTISADSSKNEATKIIEICTGVQSALTDKTSEAYTSFTAACTAAQTTPGANPGQNLSSIMTAVNSAATTLATAAATATTTSKAQDAAKEGFTDVTNVLKDNLTKKQFNSTTTVDQGTSIKIYVNRDYVFPKAAVNSARFLN
jgi:type IV secretion system protein VirB10